MAHLNDYDISNTWEATVQHSERITPEGADEVRNILLSIDKPGFDYEVGQSVGVLIAGPHELGNYDHLRLYSIAGAVANPANGGVDIELCVRRCFYIDEVSGERYPGVASNRLCDAGKGDSFTLTGPYGSQFRIPLDNRSNLIMIGTGTGIAPFRAFLQKIYKTQSNWKGIVRLFYGVRNGMEMLYRNERNADLANYYDEATFKAYESLSSRPWMGEENAIEMSLEHNAAAIWSLMQEDNTYVYLAGLEKLSGALDEKMAEAAGSSTRWMLLRQLLQEQNRWSELLYI